MRPDILVDADPFIGKWCDALDCQVSQFYEWLAWDKGVENEVKAIGDRRVNIAGRNAYLIKYWGVRKTYDAKRFADAWREQYPDVPCRRWWKPTKSASTGVLRLRKTLTFSWASDTCTCK